MKYGRLYLIPTLLGDEPVNRVLPQETIMVINRIEHFIVEEIRTARRFLRKAGITRPLEELSFELFNEHHAKVDITHLLESALNGNDTGLLSEAGTPCIADPGSALVELAHQLNIQVIPLTGPSSLLLALMASGFNGQCFTFLGYLPVDRTDRIKKIKDLERAATEKKQTQIFIETPYRNLQLFEALIQTCHEGTLLCLASDITGNQEFIRTQTILEWRSTKPDIHKKPTVFLIY